MMNVRFAPSPTGRLHAGNARIAVLNWLLARQAGGRFLLRMDDTDTGRSTADFAAAIEDDLRWLGLQWDDIAVQSQRLDHYAHAVEALKSAGRLYPCYETAEELGLKRRVALQAGRPPIYDRAALRLGAAERAALEDGGRRPHWRFRLEPTAIVWDDLVRGPVAFEGQNLTDPVLIREDGRPLYTLTSVVDDLDLGITHVLRGEDHVSNTAVQVQLLTALGGPVPAFAHMSLMVGADGGSLSKRLGSLSLRSLRDEGVEPAALTSYLARLGTPDPIVVRQTVGDLVDLFDLSRFGRATPRFDPVELKTLSARVVHGMPFEVAAPHLPAGFSPELWQVVRPNLDRVGDAAEWFRIASGPLDPVIADDDRAFVTRAAELLPPEPWGPAVWADLVAALKSDTGRKGKALFLPLRQALTGQAHGPELADLLPLIGRSRAVARLRGDHA